MCLALEICQYQQNVWLTELYANVHKADCKFVIQYNAKKLNRFNVHIKIWSSCDPMSIQIWHGNKTKIAPPVLSYHV